MTDIQQEIATFTAKLAKATHDLSEDYKKLSPEAQQIIEGGAKRFLNGYSFVNVLSYLSGQTQK